MITKKCNPIMFPAQLFKHQYYIYLNKKFNKIKSRVAKIYNFPLKLFIKMKKKVKS